MSQVVADLLQRFIRNACVNDGTITSGGESRNADLLLSEIEGSSASIERYEPFAGRTNVVARLEGSDKNAPSLALMGHMDVVPANADRWSRDPFGGEIHDAMVWGRGAVDMLNLTSSMTVVFNRLARSGFRPRGDLLLIAVADEETGGVAGANWLVDHEPDAVRTDYLITEFGGMRAPSAPAHSPAFPVTVAEKGATWVRIWTHGTPGHASIPYRTDNALIKAARIVARLADYKPVARIEQTWRSFLEGMALPPELIEPLSDPARIDETIEMLAAADTPETTGLARMVHSCTHTTMAPTILHSGVKTNVIPDSASIEVDVRCLPGEGPEETLALLREVLGDLAQDCDYEVTVPGTATQSPAEGPLWDAVARATAAMVPGARTFPMLLSGATDSRFFRKLGTTCYGVGLYSERISFAEFYGMFHGDNERIDLDSLSLTEGMIEAIVRDLL
ncbi:MAG: M20/M25/M40 family metallo-hydrolase [Actinomycetota bacterium]